MSEFKSSAKLSNKHLSNTINTNNVRIVVGSVVAFNPVTQIYDIDCYNGFAVEAIAFVKEFSFLLGLRSNFAYPIGSKVVLLDDMSRDTSLKFILGAVEDPSVTTNYTSNMIGGIRDEALYFKGGMTAALLSKMNDVQPIWSSGYQYSDVAPGESTVANSIGVGTALLETTAKLIGSGLAKVECFNMDDMVRIISDTYKHITAFGDFDIYNDNGRLNVIWKGASLENETFGTDTLNSDKGLDVDANNVQALPGSDAFYKEGRFRFASYIGKLGNVINLFISDPRPILQKFEEVHETARGRIHINEDGSILLQSLGDICIEKSICIPAPEEKDRYEFKKTTNRQLNAYQDWKPSASDDFQSIIYKWKNYTKWFTNWYSMAEFFNDSNYNVPSEVECSDPDINCKDEFKQSGNNGKEDAAIFADNLTKSCSIKLLRDGSILIVDSSGSAINMSQGNITISASKDLNFSATNNINFMSGGSLHATAIKSIELTAVKEGVLIKAKKWLQHLCSHGSILLQSSFNPTADSDATKYERAADTDKCGVIIKTDKSNISMSVSSTTNAIYIAGKTLVFRSMDTVFSSLTFTIKNIAIFSQAGIKFFSQFLANTLKAAYISVKNAVPCVTSFGIQKSLVVADESMLSPTLDDINKSSEDAVGALGGNWTDCLNQGSQAIADSLKFKYINYYDSTNDPSHVLYWDISQQNIYDGAGTVMLGNNLVQMHGIVLSSDADFGDAIIGYPYPGKSPSLNIVQGGKPSMSEKSTLSGSEYANLQNIEFVTINTFSHYCLDNPNNI